MLLPKKVGPFTLMRKLDADAPTEAYLGILDEPAGKQVVVRRVQHPPDSPRMAEVRARVQDLMDVRHATLVPVLDLIETDTDAWILEEYTDGIELSAIMDHCLRSNVGVPHNVYLSIATQVCNGLEALHSRPASHSSEDHVLHLALSPSSILVEADGTVVLAGYGLSRAPTATQPGTGNVGEGIEYLSPEQTHQDQRLSPASDVFSLGTVLYELLTLRSMFRAESNLQTIHKVRRAEVTTQLLEVKEILPGLDKVLFRALSLNPRHRYQRAFVLREDLRGLMAGFSFADIDAVAGQFLGPVFAELRGGSGASGQDAPSAVDLDGQVTNVMSRPSQWSSDESEGDADTAVTYDTAVTMDTASVTDGRSDEPTDGRAAAESEGQARPVESGRRAPPEAVVTSHRSQGRRATHVTIEPPADIGTGRRGAGVLGGRRTSTTAVPVDFEEEDIGDEETRIRRSTPGQEAGWSGTGWGQPPQPDPWGASSRDRGIGSEAGVHAVEPSVELEPTGAGESPTDLPTSDTYMSNGPPGVALHPASSRARVEPRGDARPDLGDSELFGSGHQEETHDPQTMRSITPLYGDPPTHDSGEPSSTAWVQQVARVDETTQRPSSLEFYDVSLDSEPVGDQTTVQRPHPRIDKHLSPPSTLIPPEEPPAAAPRLPPMPDPTIYEEPSMVAPRQAPGYLGSPGLPPPPPPPAPRFQPELDDDEEEGAEWAPYAVAAALVASLMAGLMCIGIGLGGSSRLMRMFVPGDQEPVGLTTVEAADLAEPATFDDVPPAAVIEPVEPEPEPRAIPRPPRNAVAVSNPPTARETFDAVVKTTPEPPRPRPAPRVPDPAPVSPAPSQARRAPVHDEPPPARGLLARTTMVAEDPVRSPADADPLPDGPGISASELQRLSEAAFEGDLDRSDVRMLADVPANDLGFTRARTLLYLDAKARGDRDALRGHLALLMSVPENKYNPVLLVEDAQEAATRHDWKKAIDRAEQAELHWARLPPDLLFSRKALIYEVEAVSWTGQFYASDGEDTEALRSAIRSWRKYRQHAATKSRKDLLGRADEQLAHLEDIERRLSQP